MEDKLPVIPYFEPETRFDRNKNRTVEGFTDNIYSFIDTANYDEFAKNTVKTSITKWILQNLALIAMMFLLFMCLYSIIEFADFIPLFVAIMLICTYELIWKLL